MSPPRENLVSICEHHSKLCCYVHMKLRGALMDRSNSTEMGCQLYICFCWISQKGKLKWNRSSYWTLEKYVFTTWECMEAWKLGNKMIESFMMWLVFETVTGSFLLQKNKGVLILSAFLPLFVIDAVLWLSFQGHKCMFCNNSSLNRCSVHH